MRRNTSPTTTAETVVLLVVIAMMVTTVGLTAPWQGVAAGESTGGQGDDSPLPTATVPPSPLPTATAEPSPIETPAPTDTPQPVVVRVLPNHSHYVDGEGRLHIVGEVQNESGSDVGEVSFGFRLLGDEGELVEAGTGGTFLKRVPAGETTCFHIALAEPAQWASVVFEAPTYTNLEGAAPDLTIVNDTGSYFAPYGWYLVGGEVRNDDSRRVGGVRAVGTVYHPAGTVLGCEVTAVLDPPANPGETRPFDLVFRGRDYLRVVAYRVQADGELE